MSSLRDGPLERAPKVSGFSGAFDGAFGFLAPGFAVSLVVLFFFAGIAVTSFRFYLLFLDPNPIMKDDASQAISMS